MTPVQPPQSTWMKYLKTAFAGIGVLVVLCCVVGLLVNRSQTDSTATKSTPQPTAVEADTAATADTSTAAASEPTAVPVEPTAEPTTVPEPVVAAVGTSRQNPAPLDTEFRGTKWAIQIVEVIRGADANAQVAKANMFNAEPPTGTEYMLVRVKVTNIATEDKAESVMFAVNVRLTGSENQLYAPESVVTPMPFEGDLFPKGSVEGQIAFAVPQGETNLMFVVNEGMSMGQPIYVAYDAGASIVPDSGIGQTDTDTGKSRDQAAKAADTMVVNPIAFKIDEIVRGADAAAMVKKANQFNDAPGAGNEYICIKITLQYLGDGRPDSTYTTFLANNEFRIIGSQNVVYKPPTVVEPAPQFSDMDANAVYAGGVISGWIVREVPAGETGLILQYQPQFDLFDTSLRYIALPQ